MSKHDRKYSRRPSRDDEMKEFFTTFTVENSKGAKVEGVFGFDAYSARKALLTARQNVENLKQSLPQDGGYRRDTVSLSTQVYSRMDRALASIGVYDTAEMDGKLLIEVR
jgi:hypothetical protein